MSALHLLALAVAAALPLPWTWRAALVLGLLAHLALVLWAQVLAIAPWSIREAQWSATGWTLTRRDGRQLEARLLPSTFIGVGLVILHLRCGRWCWRSLALPADAIDPEVLRQLRARLRRGAAADRADPTGALG